VKGFTLLEILVSTAIVAVIMAGIYTAFTSNLDVIEKARDGGEKQQIARIALDRMTKDLASAFISTDERLGDARTGMILENREMDGRPADVLNFTSLAHLPLGGGGIPADLCEIGYYLEEDPDDEVFVLFRRDSVAVDGDITEGGRAQVLAVRVTGLDFLFVDAAGYEHEEWDSIGGDEAQRNRLPSFIRVTLRVTDRKGRESAFVTGIRGGH
jgi:type II secretion system protein J